MTRLTRGDRLDSVESDGLGNVQRVGFDDDSVEVKGLFVEICS